MKCTLADKYFSLWIRLRDADENGCAYCITCGVYKPVKMMDNSHFVGRQHQATRFDEMNCHTACKMCNGFEEGRKAEYEHYLVERYGEQDVNLLKLRGQSTCHRSAFDLKQIAEFYKLKAKELSKEKGILLW
jgi:hypothetical protein